jgi:hypothetical protein
MTVDDIRLGASVGLLLAALTGVAACHRGEQTDTPTSPAKSATRTAAPVDADPVAEATRRMAAGVPMGAGTAAVDVRFDLPSAPAAGRPFDVEIAVLPQAPSPVLHIDLQPGDGIAVQSMDGALSVEKVQAGSLARVVVRAVAATPGTRIFGVKVTLEEPTGAETREFAFPVVVGVAGAPVPASSGH